MKNLRPAKPTDRDQITHLLDDAFSPSQYESGLVTRLRAHGKPIKEWVYEDKAGLAGYICYSHAFRGKEIVGYHLAPVAVRRDKQNNGIGSSMILATLPLIGDGQTPVFVLGESKYYTRLGFVHIDNPTCPFDPTNEHFLAVRCTPHSPYTIGYEEEFK